MYQSKEPRKTNGFTLILILYLLSSGGLVEISSAIDPNDHSDNRIDKDLLIFWSYFTDSNPIAEIGIFEAKSSKFLLESAKRQGRKLILLDNLEFLDEQTKRKAFCEQIILPELNKAGDCDNYSSLIDENINFPWKTEQPSYIHSDTGRGDLDIASYIAHASNESIFVLDDWATVPRQTWKFADLIINQQLFPICFGIKKLFLTKSREFHEHLVHIDLDQHEFWKQLKAKHCVKFRKYRFEQNNHIGAAPNTIQMIHYQVKTHHTNEYHEKMKTYNDRF